MAGSTLPPLISSDGHLEVRPERWTPRMPARHREHAPRTIKLPDGGDAILVEGQAPYPAPFLDLRAGRTNETWQPFGATMDDTAGVAVSLDMDFVDPTDAPGVGTPVRGGATYREAHLAMEMIADTESMASLEVVEINPILDEHNRTALLGVELVLSALGQKIL